MPKVVMAPTPQTLSKQVKNVAISRKSPKIRVVFDNPINFCRIGVIKTLGASEALHLHATTVFGITPPPSLKSPLQIASQAKILKSPNRIYILVL